MRKSTIAGLVAGGIVGLAAGGIALASRGKQQSGRFCEYRVKAGDTLSALGLKFFGDAKKWPLLLDGQTKPFDMMEVLPVGVVLRVPCYWHKVQPGETLAKIAELDLGDDGRWLRIAELNRGKLPDPNKLEVGMVLAVPLESVSRDVPSQKAVSVGGLDFLGDENIIFVGKGGGGHGGGGHGGHGHGGGRGFRGGGWGGGPYWWGPWYSDGIEVDDLEGPTAEEVAAELAKHLERAS